MLLRVRTIMPVNLWFMGPVATILHVVLNRPLVRSDLPLYCRYTPPFPQGYPTSPWDETVGEGDDDIGQGVSCFLRILHLSKMSGPMMPRQIVLTTHGWKLVNARNHRPNDGLRFRRLPSGPKG